MNVLHIVPSVAPRAGGPARSVPALVDALRERGLAASLAAHGAAKGHLVLSHLPGPGEVPTLTSVRELARAIARVDLVEIHSLWNATVSASAFLCRRAGVPYILAPRGMLDPACLATRRFAKRAYGWLVEDGTVAGAAGFHFLSEEERRDALVGRRLDDAEIAVSPNAAPKVSIMRDRGSLRARFPSIGHRRVAIYLGRVDSIKGIDLQIDALALLPATERPVLMVIGPDYGERAALTSRAADRGMADWVIFGDPVYGDDRFSLLADADLVLITSRYDANPVLVTEALAAGAVLVGTAGCGGLDAAARAGAARAVPRSTPAVAAGIAEVVRSPGECDRMRVCAREYAETALSSERTLAPLVALYERVRSGAVRTGRSARSAA